LCEVGVPWNFKKYMDEVYTAGMGGELCRGDGRTAEEPRKNYGTGGTLTGNSFLNPAYCWAIMDAGPCEASFLRA